MTGLAPYKKCISSNKVSFAEPWMNVTLLKYNRKCQKLCNKAKLDPTVHNVKRYHDYRKTLSRLKKHIKFSFYEKLFKKIGSDTKTLWSVLNSLIGKSNNKTEITELFYDNRYVTDNVQICNKVNDHFASAGLKAQQSIPNKTGDPTVYLKKVKNDMSRITVSDCELSKLVCSMKTKRSCGIDSISNDLLKSIFVSIREPFCYVVNRSFADNIFPTAMKTAKLNPLHKGGQKNLCDNLRPISLLPVLSKLIEKIMFRRTVKHLEDHDVIFAKQFGFRTNHSTNDAIHLLIGELLDGLKDKNKILAIFIDLKKAFDTVDHSLILTKLESYGIRGGELEWYRSYLSDRFQYTSMNGVVSEKRKLLVGVPQGSLLGVLLFQIVINDLHTAIRYSNVILYADDTTILIVGKNLKCAKVKLQYDMNELYNWLCLNKLSLNTAKTKMMIFSREPYFEDITIKVNDTAIELVDSFKFLGLYVDHKLCFHDHVTILYNKLLRIVYLLGKLKDFVPTGLLRNLYCAHFQSKLVYAIGAWGNLITSSDIEKLYKLQKRAIRMICNKSYRSHTGPLFKKLNISTYPDEVKLENLRLLHRLNHDILPTPVKNLFENSKSTVQTRSKNIIISKHNDSKYNSSFLVKSILYWNQLPLEMKLKNNTKMFVKKVRKLFIQEY